MNKSIERLHSYLYFILLLIITWKTMCSQICSHWLLLRSSHLVFSLIMIQILWKKSQIVNYKHAQRNDNYFYQVWRFENFCDSSKNLNISWPTQSKYIPRLNSLNATENELFQIQSFALTVIYRYKTSFLSHHYVLIEAEYMYTYTYMYMECGIFH